MQNSTIDWVNKLNFILAVRKLKFKQLRGTWSRDLYEDLIT